MIRSKMLKIRYLVLLAQLLLLFLLLLRTRYQTLVIQSKKINKSDISGIINNSDLNENIKPSTAKAELKAEQDKTVKLQKHDLSFFLGKNLFGDNGFQNMFVYQPTFYALELKKRQGH